MTNSRNPNKGHWNPAPTITHGTKTTPKTEPREPKTGKGGAR